MQPLQPVKVRSATDSAQEDDSPMASGTTPLQSKHSMLSGEPEEVPTKKWSSKIEVPIGAYTPLPQLDDGNKSGTSKPVHMQGWQYTS